MGKTYKYYTAICYICSFPVASGVHIGIGRGGEGRGEAEGEKERDGDRP